MEKLELKHVAPYLPYGLKCTNIKKSYLQTGEDRTGILENLSVKDDETVIMGDNGYFLVSYYEVVPILRPLSDLDKFRKEILKLQEINNDVALLFLNGFCYKELSVWEYEFLLENHFDIYGLIKKGLAVDIKTI